MYRGGAAVPWRKWRHGSRCADGTCLEVLFDGRDVLVRDSAQGEPSLRFTPEDWVGFLVGVKRGDFR